MSIIDDALAYLNWRILVLDSAMRPVQIKHWTVGLRLVFLNKAEVISYYDDVLIRSPTASINLPSVIRLNKHYRREIRPKFSRTNIFIRDNLECQYCGQKEKMSDLTIDHVVPKSQGGPKVWTNIVTACRPCNSKKRNRTPEQAGMVLLRKPKKMHLLSPYWMRPTDPEEWKIYFPA